jgi:predicted nucleic acid-binding protein
MNGAFLDTVGLIAVWDKSDQWHAAAQSRFLQLLHEKIPLITTSYVLVECGNAASRRPYRRRVNAIREELNDAGLLVDPTTEEIDAAWKAYDLGNAGEAGITDLMSFAVMRRLGIIQAFTNDSHFKAAGFETLF